MDIPKFKEEYEVDVAMPGQPARYRTLAVLKYSQTRSSARASIDGAAKYFGLLDVVTIWLPFIFLFVGLLLLLVGLSLGRQLENEHVEP